MEPLILQSGLRIDSPFGRLQAFCREEYEFYDSTADQSPNSFCLMDVLVTVTVNSKVDTGKKVRNVFRGLAQIEGCILKSIPIQADLSQEEWPRLEVECLISHVIAIRQIKLSVATKVLHRKRRQLIPILDSVVMGHYVNAFHRRGWKAELDDTKKGKRAARAAIELLERFRNDLIHARSTLADLDCALAKEGFRLSHVRILELLIWMHYTNRYPAA